MSGSAAWTELGDGAWVRQSRAYEMNTTVLVQDGWALLVDPGVLPSELDDLAAFVASHAPRFEQVAIAFTHPHWDHVLGLRWFPGASTLAHAGFFDVLQVEEATIERKAKEYVEGAGEAWPTPFTAFEPRFNARGTVGMQLGPFSLVTHELPGHDANQIALHFPDRGLFVAADTLSDIEIPWLDAPAWVYRKSLEALTNVFEHEDIRVLVPGHGPIAMGRNDAYRRLLRDIAYLRRIEEGVTSARGRGLSMEDTRTELEAMDYLGKDAAYSMNDVHRENIRFTYEGMAALER